MNIRFEVGFVVVLAALATLIDFITQSDSRNIVLNPPASFSSIQNIVYLHNLKKTRKLDVYGGESMVMLNGKCHKYVNTVFLLTCIR